MSPGKQLKAWRVARKLSQERAAELAGSNSATWSDVERGALVTKRTAQLILDATGIVLDVRREGRPPEGDAGSALRAWRLARGLTCEAAGALIGCSAQPVRLVESGKHVTPATAKLILAATGIVVPTGDKRVENSFASVTAPKTKRHCHVCCGLPHRRPMFEPCRCGEAFAPERLERPAIRVGVWEP